MSLYCSNCRKGIPDGYNQCLECRAGFVHQLVCLHCQRQVPRGATMCLCETIARMPLLPRQPPAEIQYGVLLPEVTTSDSPVVENRIVRQPTTDTELGLQRGDVSTLVGFVSPQSAPSALPGLPAHVSAMAIRETYEAGRYGVTATVSMPPKDVEIMNKLGQMVVLLHTVAQEMNQFQGHTEHTRMIIRAMRNLATDIQDEIEIRTGPPG